MSVLSAPHFHNEKAAYAYVEARVWPEGPVCPHCGCVGRIFQDFQAQIEGTENRINVARQDYNEAVKTYNLKVKTFPNNIFAGLFGFHEKAFYKANAGTENPPDTEFNIK